MVTAADWSEAYRQQAMSDLRGARLIQGEEPSVLAMLLQMIFEKLGKAALLRSGMMSIEAAQATHQAATTMMRVLASSRRKSERVGFNRNFVRHTLVPMMEQLESLNPSVVRRRGSTGPWLEYPWESPDHKVCWPSRDLPGLDEFRTRRGIRSILLVDLAQSLIEHLNEVFG